MWRDLLPTTSRDDNLLIQQPNPALRLTWTINLFPTSTVPASFIVLVLGDGSAPAVNRFRKKLGVLTHPELPTVIISVQHLNESSCGGGNLWDSDWNTTSWSLNTYFAEQKRLLSTFLLHFQRLHTNWRCCQTGTRAQFVDQYSFQQMKWFTISEIHSVRNMHMGLIPTSVVLESTNIMMIKFEFIEQVAGKASSHLLTSFMND